MEAIALVGRPNSGKSSLFNLLTGLNQKIANYSGATVDIKKGLCEDRLIEDLPGIKSLRSPSFEERIAKDEILKRAHAGDPILFIANGMQLEESMLFFSEIADLQVPTALVINFKDDLEKNKIKLDPIKLSDQLGCPVMLMNSRAGKGLQVLKSFIKTENFKIPNAVCRSLYDQFEEGEVSNNYINNMAFNKADEAFAEGDFPKRQKIIGSIMRNAIVDISERQDHLQQSKTWDKILLHPIWGILFFAFVMLLVFQSVFFLAGIPMDWIDGAFAAASEWSRSVFGDSWLGDLISDGILPGLGGVLIFIPQIAILFFLLGVLEHSGYLSRISFIANRFLSKFGLSGQSVIPLMSSWACAIPAIMSARMINDPKERMAVILASPLMTCSARLPVYTILIAIMYPGSDAGFFNSQGIMLLGLYLLGVVSTLLVALLSSKTSKIEGNQLWSLELPIYRVPNWRNVIYNMYQKTKAFVVDAGKVIFIVSIVLWLLASHSPKSDAFIESQHVVLKQESGNQNLSMDAVQLEYSYAGYLGKFIEPVIEPLGYDWKIGIALISSFAAREVFVGSLSTIYSVGSEEESLIQARMENELNIKTGEARFDLPTCFSLLLFYVFALQCMSTLAIVRKETGNWRYPLQQFLLMLVLAYVAAYIGYNIF